MVQNDREAVIERATGVADPLVQAQIGLAETLYRREWDEVTAPLLSILLPGISAGGMSAVLPLGTVKPPLTVNNLRCFI